MNLKDPGDVTKLFFLALQLPVKSKNSRY